MPSPAEKGNALEVAVSAIESTILRSSPSLRENTFTLESKKRVTAAGVHHEIDIYVEVAIGDGYKAIFIFECKNWESTVGKNEIIVFSEKIQATEAQRGFFVAKSFTKDASAQAAKDSRITLLHATEYNASEIPVPFDFHVVIREQTDAGFEVRQRGLTSSGRRETVDVDKTRAVLQGTAIDFKNYLQEWISKTCDTDLLTFQSQTLPEGVYQRETTAQREFNENELLLNGIDVASAALEIKFSVRVVRPRVISVFDISSRGRALSLAPVTIGGATIQIGFVARQ